MSQITHNTKFGWAVITALTALAMSYASLAYSFGKFEGTTTSQLKTQGEDIATIKDALLIKSLANH